MVAVLQPPPVNSNGAVVALTDSKPPKSRGSNRAIAAWSASPEGP